MGRLKTTRVGCCYYYCCCCLTRYARANIFAWMMVLKVEKFAFLFHDVRFFALLLLLLLILFFLLLLLLKLWNIFLFNFVINAHCCFLSCDYYMCFLSFFFLTKKFFVFASFEPSYVGVFLLGCYLNLKSIFWQLYIYILFVLKSVMGRGKLENKPNRNKLFFNFEN